MDKIYLHKNIRIVYYSFSLLIFFLSIYNVSTSSSVFYLNDYIFIAVLAVSFILLNKYSIPLKETNLNFNDFILIVCYMQFNIYLTILLIFICYSASFLIEYKHSKNLNLLTENIHIFNSSLVILSAFIGHIIISSIDNIYYIKSYEITSLIIYSILLLITNYILYCLEISVQKWEFTLITLENGLYYVLLNFTICTVIASFAMYLYRLYDYIPIVAMTAFIIFISFALNGMNKLKTSNRNLKAISECSALTISKADFKVKLQNALQTIQYMLPFVYCGIYLTREKYTSLYPTCYKCNDFANIEDLKFFATQDNSVYAQIMSGMILHKESRYFTSCLPIVNNFSDKIKYTAAVPIKNSDATAGFVLLCFDRYLDIDEELQLISLLGTHIGMVNYHIATNIENNLISYKSYDGLTRYIDYNIKHKIFFTLAVLEIENYKEIIQKYNSDFYEAYKLEIGRLISNFLCTKDSILCFEKEDIYIVFNLLDSTNAHFKLKEISEFLENFKFKDILLRTSLSYASSEYPMDGISGDEILANVYRKLQNIKSA
jgi:GGDEF domain-containing protein